MQVPFANGAAVFNLLSQKCDVLLLSKLSSTLQPLKNHSIEDIHSKLHGDDKLNGMLTHAGGH